MLLIVDSDKDTNKSVEQLFIDYGFERVELVKTAAAARKVVAQSKKISLLIINDNLIDADACLLAKELREIEACKDAYIYIVISSINNKTAIEKIQHSSADNYIVKPYLSADFQKQFLSFMLSKVVLLVEDDPVIQKMVVNVLSKYSVKTIVIDDGISAYNYLNTQLPVKLVLLDIKLPNMNGLQLLKQLRSKTYWRNIPVVMLTGSSDSSDVKIALASGANDYITKPFKIEQFMTRLERFLGDDN